MTSVSTSGRSTISHFISRTNTAGSVIYLSPGNAILKFRAALPDALAIVWAVQFRRSERLIRHMKNLR